MNADIAGKILQLWFPDQKYNRLWFKSTDDDDKMIATEFSEILTIMEKEPMNTDAEITEMECCASIILFDQLSRHINRKGEEKKNDHLAIKYATYYVDHKLEKNTDSILHILFSLMPFRHRHTEKDVDFLMKKIDELEKGPHKDSPHLRRFKNAFDRS